MALNFAKLLDLPQLLLFLLVLILVETLLQSQGQIEFCNSVRSIWLQIAIQQSEYTGYPSRGRGSQMRELLQEETQHVFVDQGFELVFLDAEEDLLGRGEANRFSEEEVCGGGGGLEEGDDIEELREVREKVNVHGWYI